MQIRKWMISRGKQIMLLFVVLLFLVGPVFAADGSSSGETTDIEKLAWILFKIGDIASWIWIILGNFAGKLMTNTLVYGEFMGLDSFLWKVWQIMRTFANYAIGFLFGYSIFKYVLFPSEKIQTPMKTIKELLVASVLVQASRFLVMVVVDISTIALATVSSFPSQVLSNSSYSQNVVIQQIKANKVLGSAIKEKPEAVVVQPYVDSYEKESKQFSIEFIPLDKQIDEKSLVDNLLPKPDNLAGPLTYLGFSVFKTHNFLREYKVKDADTVERLTKIIISLMFDAGMIILFSFALAVLVIILIVRLAYLWLFIAASPIIVLMAVTKTVDLGKISEFLDIKKILNLIFKPVIFSLWISVMFLVVVVMQGFFAIGSGDFNGALKIKETSLPTADASTARYSSELQISEVANIAIYQGTKSLKDIIISLITLIMMWYFVKLALTSKTGTSLDKFTKGVADMTGKAFGNIGIIPTPTGTIGFSQIWKNGSSPFIDTATNHYTSGLQRNDAKGEQELAKMFGLSIPISSLTKDQVSELERSVTNSSKPSDFPKLIKDFKSKNRGIKFAEIKPYIPQWIAKHQQKTENLKAYLGDGFIRANPDFGDEDQNKREVALDALFKDQKIFQTFYKNVLGGQDTSMDYQKLNTTHGDIKHEE